MQVLALPHAARAAAGAPRWFLRLEGPVEGISGSANRWVADWIAIETFDLPSEGLRGGPGGHARRLTAHSVLRLTKRPDNASPEIYRAAMRGDHLQAELRSTGAGKSLRMELTDARIVSIALGPGGRERIELWAETIAWFVS